MSIAEFLSALDNLGKATNKTIVVCFCNYSLVFMVKENDIVSSLSLNLIEDYIGLIDINYDDILTGLLKYNQEEINKDNLYVAAVDNVTIYSMQKAITSQIKYDYYIEGIRRFENLREFVIEASVC